MVLADRTGECMPCTAYDSISCPAGLLHTGCTGTQDASCSKRCDVADMPMSHAGYVLSDVGDVPRLMEADNLMSPNMGCAWSCDPGYHLSVTSGGLRACRLGA